MTDDDFKEFFVRMMRNKDNPYHPLVWINGSPEIGEGTYIGGMTLINAKGARVMIGKGCDIASFVSINVSDTHRRCIGLAEEANRNDIIIGDNVFIGTHSAFLGGAKIGKHSVVEAGTIVRACEVPSWSLIIGNPMTIKPGYYEQEHQDQR